MHRQRPRLKNGVDLQLQSVFSDGNWPAVIRLAEKRARSLNDPYYEVLKTCAESQVDDPSAKMAGVAKVSQYVSEGTVLKDVDALDLLEWATLDLTEEDDFLDTMGPLRVKAVKASPKDKNIASRCLESCLIHWDLASAQQIAAVLDRSFPQERQYMFWNIVITHMLSTSLQIPDEKKKLYSTLALRQMDRAAKAAEQEDASEGPPARSVQTEEEILLLYDIVETHGTPEDFENLVNSKKFSPLTQFRLGRKELFLRAIANYKRQKNWKVVYQLCKEGLSENDDEGRPNMLASDYGVWEEFIMAASRTASSDDTVVKTVQEILNKLIKSPGLRPIYRRNLLLARVSAAFHLLDHDGDDRTDDQASSVRLQELLRYIEDQVASPACFDDVKTFVEKLDLSGMQYLSSEFLPGLRKKLENSDSSDQASLLVLKTQYLVATCPLTYTSIPGDKPTSQCVTCESEGEVLACFKCFRKIWNAGLELYKDIATRSPDKLSNDPQIPPDLALLVAFCSIKLASPAPGLPLNSRSASQTRHLFHATLVLEYQLSFSPKCSPLLLVLTQLHLLLGSAPRARQLWEELGIKRTIMDSLAPLFYDRLSTVAPALLSPLDNSGWQLMDLLTSHYSYSLRLRMPRRLVDAFESESYSSVLEIPKYILNLRTSATRVMSLVEEARSERFLGAPTYELLSDARFVEVSDATCLREVLDYGSFPSWDSSESTQVYERLRLGQPLTNRRMHLALLSEAFHDVLGYKQPQMYKVPLRSSESDHAFAAEALTRIGHSFTRFLSGPDKDLTPAEALYYDVIGLLSALAPLCTERGRAPGFEGTFCELADSVLSGLGSLKQLVPHAGSGQVEETVCLLGSLHSVGVYRDAANGVLLASQWITGINERAKERDRSGQSNLPKDIMSKVKALQTAAEAAMKEGRGWVTGLKKQVSGDFQARFRSWLFEGAEVMQDVAYEEVVPGLAANIKDNVEGWQQVRWE